MAMYNFFEQFSEPLFIRLEQYIGLTEFMLKIFLLMKCLIYPVRPDVFHEKRGTADQTMCSTGVPHDSHAWDGGMFP